MFWIKIIQNSIFKLISSLNIVVAFNVLEPRKERILFKTFGLALTVEELFFNRKFYFFFSWSISPQNQPNPGYITIPKKENIKKEDN